MNEETAVSAPLERRVRRPGAWLPALKELGETADQCRELGLQVGDTITGREHGPPGVWHEARLTLLWLGQSEAVFLAQSRTHERHEWSAPEEACNWTLECRRWRWTPNVALSR